MQRVASQGGEPQYDASCVKRDMMLARGFACLVSLALIAAPVCAHQTSAPVMALYAQGDYLAAAHAAETSAGADDLAFAARALLAACMTRDEEPDASLVDRAERDAEAALKIEPNHEEGQLQLAIALSLKSRRMDVLDAWSAGYGDRGRDLAEQVLKQDPSNFYAHGFLAVWNVEVRRRGGTIGAAFMGASVSEGRKHYVEAARLAPGDIGVHWQWARALAALDVKRYGAEALAALDKANAATPKDHVEQVMQTRALKLAAALRGTDRVAAQALARTLL